MVQYFGVEVDRRIHESTVDIERPRPFQRAEGNFFLATINQLRNESKVLFAIAMSILL